MKGIAIVSVTADNLRLLDQVAPDVFDAPVDPDRLRTYANASLNHLVIALDGDLVVGQARATVHLQPDAATQLYIDNLGISPTHKRRGIARALVARLFAWGREQGCADGWVATETDNEEGNQFYRQVLGEKGIAMIYYEFNL